MHYYQFKSPTILQVSGPDAVRYMNARLTNDYKNLAVGQANMAAALTPQGKTEAFFAVYRLEDDSFLLTCDGGPAEQVVKSFLRFKVADRVDVEDLSTTFTLLHFAGDEVSALATALKLDKPPVSEMSFTLSDTKALLLKRARFTANGYDLILPIDTLTVIRDLKDKKLVEMNDQYYELLRLKSGAPSYPQEINDRIGFSESKQYQAISRTKGCYVGQEVIEKIDALGKAPKILVRIQASARLSPGEEVFSDAEGKRIKAGLIISAAYDEAAGLSYAFARVKNDTLLLSSNLFIGENPVTLSMLDNV